MDMKEDINLTKELKNILLKEGADLVGVGNLSELPKSVRYNLPIGIAVAIKYPKAVIQGISELPTQEYRNWYGLLNEQLDNLITIGATFLQKKGYQAIAKTRKQVGYYGEDCITELPHKTIATRTGIGWIGKSALLITKQYGSMVRISSILTDAPLIASKSINQSLCGSCTICQSACPAKAIYGMLWNTSVKREQLFDYQKCRKMAQLRSEKGFGKPEDLCGKCIEVCPYTKRYIKQK